MNYVTMLADVVGMTPYETLAALLIILVVFVVLISCVVFMPSVIRVNNDAVGITHGQSDNVRGHWER